MLVVETRDPYQPPMRKLLPCPPEYARWWARPLTPQGWHTLMPVDYMRLAEPGSPNFRPEGLYLTGWDPVTQTCTGTTTENPELALKLAGELEALFQQAQRLSARWAPIERKYGTRQVPDTIATPFFNEAQVLQRKAIDLKVRACNARQIRISNQVQSMQTSVINGLFKAISRGAVRITGTPSDYGTFTEALPGELRRETVRMVERGKKVAEVVASPTTWIAAGLAALYFFTR